MQTGACLTRRRAGVPAGCPWSSVTPCPSWPCSQVFPGTVPAAADCCVRGLVLFDLQPAEMEVRGGVLTAAWNPVLCRLCYGALCCAPCLLLLPPGAGHRLSSAQQTEVSTFLRFLPPQVLDEFEGEEYYKQEVVAQLEGGGTAKTIVYLWQDSLRPLLYGQWDPEQFRCGL